MSAAHQSLIYIFRGGDELPRQVLLGEKLRGFGRGNVMGPGGHREDGETDREAAIRELGEETGVIAAAADVEQVATLTFRFPADPTSDAIVSVFTAATWTGTVRASDELAPQWYDVDAIPLDRMWDDDRYWLPRILAGERLTAEFSYDDAGTRVVSHRITPTHPTDPAPPISP
ncbi:8-oxo-dGTP diphosphatase [Microlunatus soli]|uniref:Oxidized purine nucleoside triphosphate hydrolase n=1 Tax=Microlunatus soli TaxID=630515 RepID=A0A1H1XS06_9ACTN|nr:8-oxo-dGTP diphosphatase [Microlunatus soli]SDT11811.1 8-oxo-dGTP diphosphatase [Microlunatus soli]